MCAWFLVASHLGIGVVFWEDLLRESKYFFISVETDANFSETRRLMCISGKRACPIDVWETSRRDSALESEKLALSRTTYK